jgi:hypothetical protein
MSSLAVESKVFAFARFLNARKCYGPSFSPDNPRASLVSALSRISRAWMISARSGWPEQLTFTDKGVGLATFASNAERLIIGTEIGGDGNIRFWMLAAEGSPMHLLTNQLENKRLAYPTITRFLDRYFKNITDEEAACVLVSSA